MMTLELQKYYEEQFSMMASEGWKDMCDDLNVIAVSLKDITTAAPDTLLNRQGRIAEINHILNRRATFISAYEELNTNAP
jgi:hypothetical protein